MPFGDADAATAARRRQLGDVGAAMMFRRGVGHAGLRARWG